MRKLIVALVRAHKRARTLRIVLTELERYDSLPGLEVRAHVLMDRPTDEVREIVSEQRMIEVYSEDCPFPIVSMGGGERFCEALNLQLDALEKKKISPNWILRQDDDHWFEPLSITEELPQVVLNQDVDLWFCNFFFMWAPGVHNARRTHRTPNLFRYLEGDRFPTNRIIHATENLHDTAILESRFGELKTPILEYGSYTRDEREEGYRRFVEAGKDDPFVQTLIEPPDLQPLPQNPWLDLYEEEMMQSG